MEWRISDPSHLLGALRIGIAQGGHFLVARIAPNGPILEEPNLSYIHKTTWGMYEAGVDHDTIARLLDWACDHALQGNGDFYLPGEAVEYKDLQRVYRPLTFGKVAAWIGHPLVRDQKVIDRICQYQHDGSGGVFHYIGDDPGDVQEQVAIGTLNTTFFGHFMIALDMRDRAAAVAEWVRRWVEANRAHLAEGTCYTTMTPGGELVTDVADGVRIGQVVDRHSAKQEFWQVGTTMAFLAAYYETACGQWNCSEADVRPYLDAALELLAFEDAMPLDTYLWPCKCKVAWGAGEVLRVLIERGLGTDEQVEQAYRATERTAIFTFLDNQHPDGSWSCMHYPLSERIPEMAVSYKPLKGIVHAPPRPITDTEAIFLPAEEVAGEFTAEMAYAARGVAAMVGREAAGV